MERFFGGEHFLDKTLSILHSRPIFHLVGDCWIPIKKKKHQKPFICHQKPPSNGETWSIHGRHASDTHHPTPGEFTICFLGNQT